MGQNAFAVWILTTEGKVLLQRDKNASKYQRENLFGPIKEWVSREEHYTHQLSRMVREAMAKLGMKCKLQFSKEPIAKEEIEPYQGQERFRYHFICRLETDVSPSSTSMVPGFLLIGKEDVSKIKALTKSSRKDKIVFYDYDYNLLIKEIWKIQRTLVPTW